MKKILIIKACLLSLLVPYASLAATESAAEVAVSESLYYMKGGLSVGTLAPQVTDYDDPSYTFEYSEEFEFEFDNGYGIALAIGKNVSPLYPWSLN